MVKILFLCHSLYDMWRDCIIAFKVIIHLPVGNNFAALSLLLLCESITISGLGLFFGLAIKSFTVIQNFLNLPIVIFGFLGGAFFSSWFCQSGTVIYHQSVAADMDK